MRLQRLAQNNLAARAESRSQLPQSSQPGVQLFQAPAVLGSHSSMQQPCHLCRGLAVLAAAAAAVAAMPECPKEVADGAQSGTPQPQRPVKSCQAQNVPHDRKTCGRRRRARAAAPMCPSSSSRAHTTSCRVEGQSELSCGGRERAHTNPHPQWAAAHSPEYFRCW